MKNIHKSTPPSFRRRENAAAIVKAPPLGINFKNGPTPDRGAVPNPGKRRRHAFSAVAFLAVLAVGLLFLLPGGLLQAQDDGTIEYAENGTDPVATYTGIDPEGRPIYWSLHPAAAAADLNNDGDTDDEGEADSPSTDADDFMISGDGVLTFKLPPDFETMMDGTGNDSNTYNVVVVSSDDAPGAALVTDGNIDIDLRKKAYKQVTVEVTDVDEDGNGDHVGPAAPAGSCFEHRWHARAGQRCGRSLERPRRFLGPNHRCQVEVGAVLGYGRPLDPHLR